MNCPRSASRIVRKLWTTSRNRLKINQISCRQTNRDGLPNMSGGAYAGKISGRSETAFASARRTKILSRCRQKKNPARTPGFENSRVKI
jgi:hypothetical protein